MAEIVIPKGNKWEDRLVFLRDHNFWFFAVWHPVESLGQGIERSVRLWVSDRMTNMKATSK
jgi:hypothetical protein